MKRLLYSRLEARREKIRKANKIWRKVRIGSSCDMEEGKKEMKEEERKRGGKEEGKKFKREKYIISA